MKRVAPAVMQRDSLLQRLATEIKADRDGNFIIAYLIYLMVSTGWYS